MYLPPIGGKVGRRKGVVCHWVKSVVHSNIKGTSSGRAMSQVRTTPTFLTSVLTVATFLNPAKNL
ncbi:hypothetical protein EQ500_05795 [Lactobacillus sp. XV13L]|nr:hypothetical protein [Lactobacillus sp. XV13L]